MATLSAVRPHLPTLARIGCRTLGDLRRLPRAGLARRFDAALLAALDQAYGRAPETHVWVTLPPVFDARLELRHRVDSAEALVFGARRLLLQLSAWLSARHSGVTAFTLHWAHDAMRSRGVGEGGQLTVRTAEPTREAGHLARLLAEHLSHVALAAPVGDLRLTAEDVVPLARHFLAEVGRRYRRPRRLTADAEASLRAYPWPGNVREVANVIERAVLLHEGEEIGAGVLGLPSLGGGGAPVEVGGGGGVRVDFSQGGLSLSELERTLIVEALKASGGNRRRAAELLGISVETLRYRMEKHALTSADHDPG